MDNPPPDPLGGLDPANLLKQGVAEDTCMDGASSSFNPPPIEELAAIFPQFEILELIGKGGMGAVYKVRQKDLDRVVALKILPPDIGQSAEFSNRFTREAKALAKLNHPGIVTIHEFGQQGGLYFILMEFVDGVNLGQLMKSGRVSPREALAIVPQICDALQFAHDQGIVHRDIKPENLLLDRLGRVKVADFGIAKLVVANSSFVVPPSGGSEAEVRLKAELPTYTEAGKIIGTPQYMAPEQIDRPADVDHRADIYALGVVFYQMLTGELPGKDLQMPSRKVQIDVRLDEIVMRAMEKDPEQRYQQASVMKTMVENSENPPSIPARLVKGWEMDYQSKTRWFGWPLLHVTSGPDPESGRERVAKGVIAIGGKARGVLAVGGQATGIFAFGGIAMGVFAFGGLALGGVAWGGFALALAALGGMAIGGVAIGGSSIGYYSYGASAHGRHCLGGNAADPLAKEFFLPWGPELLGSIGPILLVIMCFVFFVSFAVPMWIGQRQGGGSHGPSSKREGRMLAAKIAIPVILVVALFAGLDWLGHKRQEIGSKEAEAMILANEAFLAEQARHVDTDLLTSHSIPDKLTHTFVLNRGVLGGVDLDSVRFMLFDPTGGINDPAGAVRWREDNGIDLVLDEDSHTPGVLVTGTQVKEVAGEWWEDTPEAGVVEAILPPWGKTSMFDERMTFLAAQGPSSGTKTHVYRTLAGNVGILRIGPTNSAGGAQAEWRVIVNRHPAEIVRGSPVESGVPDIHEADLSEPDEMTILNLETGTAERMTEETVEQAVLPDWSLVYYRVDDTDGRTGEVSESRHFFLTRATSFSWMRMPVDFKPGMPIVNGPAVHAENFTDKLLSMRLSDAAVSGHWYAYEMTLPTGERGKGLVRVRLPVDSTMPCSVSWTTLESVEKAPESLPPLVITLEMDGGLVMEGNPITREMLKTAILHRKELDPEPAVVIKADAQLKYSKIQEVVGNLAELGIVNLGISRSNLQTADPSIVTVEIRGAVGNPGAFQFRKGGSLLDVMARAGGWVRNGDLQKIQIRIPGDAEAQVHDLTAILSGKAVNPILPSGAMIEIPEKPNSNKITK